MGNVYYSGSGNTIHLEQEIGRGGEGLIYLIKGYPSDVAKIYINQQPPEIHRKILEMIKDPPLDPTANGPIKHRSISWPNDVLYADRQKTQFAGFQMPRIEMKVFRKILSYISPDDRVKSFMGGFTWYHLHTTAFNLASCIAAIHARGYCVGDINESNILVEPRTPLTIIDCDSFQVKDSVSGSLWRCSVGKDDYTAPEIIGKNFRNVDRTTETDCFALAVMIFQLLMEGYHPYAARGSLVDNAPLARDKIKLGIFAFGAPRKGIAPPPDAPSFDILHPEIRALFLRAFDAGHKNPSIRPSAKEWMSALKKLNQNFTKCITNENHRYHDHLNYCPWCARAKNSAKDSFPSPIGQQVHILDPNNQMISRQERETYLLAFIEMALMDGYVSPQEEAALIDQGLKLHISEKETKKLIADEIKKIGLTPSSGGRPIPHVDKSYFQYQNIKNGAILHETIEISNVGDGVLTGSILSLAPWIKVPASIAPNIKNQSQKIQLTIDTSSLSYGFSGMGTIKLKTNGGDISISVNLETEGLLVLVSKFRSSYLPFLASFFGLVCSFIGSPFWGFFNGAFFSGFIMFVLSTWIVKYILNRGFNVFKIPSILTQGAAVGIVILTVFTHSNSHSGIINSAVTGQDSKIKQTTDSSAPPSNNLMPSNSNIESSPGYGYAAIPNQVVGTKYVMETLNSSNPKLSYSSERKITSIEQDRVIVSIRNLKSNYVRTLKYDKQWNLISTRGAAGEGSEYSPPVKYFDFPLEPGKRWSGVSTERDIKTMEATREHRISAKVGGWETISVPAGTFQAIKVIIKNETKNLQTGEIKSGSDISWYAPSVGRSVKSVLTTRNTIEGTEDKTSLTLLSYSKQSERITYVPLPEAEAEKSQRETELKRQREAVVQRQREAETQRQRDEEIQRQHVEKIQREREAMMKLLQRRNQ